MQKNVNVVCEKFMKLIKPLLQPSRYIYWKLKKKIEFHQKRVQKSDEMSTYTSNKIKLDDGDRCSSTRINN